MKVTDQDLDKLTLPELEDLMSMTRNAMSRKREDQYSEAREKIDEIALSVGLSADELLKKTEKPVKARKDDDYHP